MSKGINITVTPEPIPEKVVEIAEFIKQCDIDNSYPVIMQRRRSGLVQAYRLARETEDADFEVAAPKQLTNP